jgi:prepilin-type N-terminal cleavage/methylation domain-containing protein
VIIMLNKIFFKKIKFPLSLRGAFPHVIARERSDRSNLNHSGFSLIELMVAVVILAMAIFGIFHAYSVGFMGMADARDRTVATNYAREAMEDFKNMDFEQVKSDPITLIPDTKFSRGSYILNLEKIDGVVTLKKVITQVRWIDRKGNIKTEKASTIIYNKPATSEIDDPERIIIYAQPYYTILPSYAEGLDLYAEIKDENGNTVYSGDITFSIITTYGVGEAPVGYIYNENRTLASPEDTGTESAPNGIANVKFYPFTVGEDTPVDGIERIQASAIINGVEETDTVNIRVTTGPVGIILEPATKDDKILPAGETSNINLTVVKADYSTHIEYDSPITLSTDIGSPGTLSTTTIPSVPTDGTTFSLISNGTPGIVEITASAPDLDMGYTEITFTGEPTSILVTPEKKSIYPSEDIDIIVTIVDVNNVPVGYNGTVNLTALPNYGSFNSDSLIFTGQSTLDTAVFTANSDAPPGKIVTIQANAPGDLSGSTDITILSSLTPKYLKLFAYPTSVDLIGGETHTTITATVYDDSGDEIVTTYNTPINFISKKDEISFGSFLPSDHETPIDGEAEIELSSTIVGTTIVTASSGDLILKPEGGVEVVFYQSADHIELSADPLSIEADGHETSIITATVCDYYGNRVANYGNDPDNPKTITLSLTEESKGIFIDGSRTIGLNEFDEGVVTTSLSSTEPGTATITASSSDGLSDNGHIPITLTGNIATEISNPFNIINWDDYRISFDLTVTGSPLYLTKINVEWNNSHAVLNDIIIRSPYDEEEVGYYTINANGSPSPYNNISIEDTLTIEKKSTIYLHFGDVSNAAAKMKNNTVIVTLTDEDNIEYPPLSFKVP